MKKGIIVLVVIGLCLLWFVSKYNGLVGAQESIDSVWAKVETQYQRRADLIPNLVSTVKGYADFEQETLTKVVEARAKATQTTIDPSNMTSAQLQNFQGAQGELSGALSRLLVTIEKYPDLKANQNFLELQAELAGTENRIGVARDNFNSEAKNYNTTIKKFPTNLIAGLFNFEAKPYFEADAGSKNAPKVEF
jgi:LemA protein|tara:strand:+ start:11889 stop:12467 length:579 start_codon:yes stop_codon:yes gene_type:complete